MQIDNPERGFSYKTNATLDMRMDVTKNKPAHELLRNMTVKRLAHILTEFSDEPYADTIALGDSLTHALTHSLTHALTHSLTHSLTEGVIKDNNTPQSTLELGNKIKEVLIYI